MTFVPVPEPDIAMDVPCGGWPCAIAVAGDGRLISGDDARGGEDGERSREGGGGGEGVSNRRLSIGILEEDVADVAICTGVGGQYVSCGERARSLGGKITPGGGTMKLLLFCFPGT